MPKGGKPYPTPKGGKFGSGKPVKKKPKGGT